jgi:hypothetical protein
VSAMRRQRRVPEASDTDASVAGDHALGFRSTHSVRASQAFGQACASNTFRHPGPPSAVRGGFGGLPPVENPPVPAGEDANEQ